MTSKFIFHIGPAKTGTSSLQEVLFANRELLMKHNIYYPEFGRHPQMLLLPGHHGIPARLSEHNEVPPGVLENLEKLPKDRTTVFSSENFSHLQSPAIRTLIEALGAAEFEVVYYARRWDQLLPSIWQELVKHGDSRPYLEFLNNNASAPRASIYLNYAISLDKWSNVIGLERLRIFSYDNVRSAGDDVVGHFGEKVLGQRFAFDAGRQDNARQSASLTETLRMLNRLALGTKPATPRIRHAFTRNSAGLTEELTALEAIHRDYTASASPCAPFVLRHIEDAVLKKYSSRVENLTAAGRLFDDSRLERGSYVRSEYIFETDALALYRDILEKIGETPRKQAAS